jgi:hypothetical protein
VTFTLTPEEFAAVEGQRRHHDPYGVGHDDAGWRFGRITRASREMKIVGL